MPVFAYSRPCHELCKKKEEIGEDENPKKVLGAANASRAKNHGQYHTLFADLRHPRVRHFPPPF